MKRSTILISVVAIMWLAFEGRASAFAERQSVQGVVLTAEHQTFEADGSDDDLFDLPSPVATLPQSWGIGTNIGGSNLYRTPQSDMVHRNSVPTKLPFSSAGCTVHTLHTEQSPTAYYVIALRKIII